MKFLMIILSLLLITGISEAATLYLSPLSGPVLTTVEVTDDGFISKTPSGGAKITFDYITVNYCKSSNGFLSNCYFNVPTNFNTGKHTVTAWRVDGFKPISTTFTVTNIVTIPEIIPKLIENVTYEEFTPIASISRGGPLFTFGKGNTDRYCVFKQQGTVRAKYFTELILWDEGYLPLEYKKFETKYKINC